MNRITHYKYFLDFFPVPDLQNKPGPAGHRVNFWLKDDTQMEKRGSPIDDDLDAAFDKLEEALENYDSAVRENQPK